MKMQEQPQSTKWFQSRRTTLVLLGLIVVGAFFLITGHTAHVLSILPFAIFLLCPLMMLFMHGGHGNHNGHDGNPPENQQQPPEGGHQ